MTVLLSTVILWIADDPAPKDSDVKAGWTAFVIFLLLIAALVFLCFSFVKQLRKARAAQEAGVFGSDDDEKQESETRTQH